MTGEEYEAWHQNRNDKFGHKFDAKCKVSVQKAKFIKHEADRKLLFNLIDQHDLELKKVKGMNYIILIKLEGGFVTEIPSSELRLGERSTYEGAIEAIVKFLDDLDKEVI